MNLGVDSDVSLQFRIPVVVVLEVLFNFFLLSSPLISIFISISHGLLVQRNSNSFFSSVRMLH